MHFCFEHTVPLPRERIFSFFQNPERLEVLHAGWSEIRLLQHETQVRVGAETWIELTVAGFLPVVLGFRHLLFEPPFRFGEEAIHGPFSRFVHFHEFHAQGESTVVRDLLEVRLPWHYGGEIIMQRSIACAIKRMFRNRAQVLTRLVCEGAVPRWASRSVPPKES